MMPSLLVALQLTEALGVSMTDLVAKLKRRGTEKRPRRARPSEGRS